MSPGGSSQGNISTYVRGCPQTPKCPGLPYDEVLRRTVERVCEDLQRLALTYRSRMVMVVSKGYRNRFLKNKPFCNGFLNCSLRESLMKKL